MSSFMNIYDSFKWSSWFLVASTLLFCVMFCKSLFVLYFIWPSYCVSCHLRLLVILPCYFQIFIHLYHCNLYDIYSKMAMLTMAEIYYDMSLSMLFNVTFLNYMFSMSWMSIVTRENHPFAARH